MELNHLKYFYVVAKQGGFSKASKVMRVAQPAISKMVKNLEESLDVDLFERVGRNVRLTKVGNDIYRKCEVIFGHIDELLDLVNPQSKAVSGPLNLCAVDVVASGLLPGALKGLLSQHSRIYPQVTTTTASEACRCVSAMKADAALLFHTPDLPQGLEVRHVFPLTFRLVVATKFKKSPSVCSAFISSREIDDTANRTSPTLTKLRKKFPDAEIKISLNSLHAHQQMVLEGLGVSILPEFLVGDDISNGRLSCLLKEQAFVFNLKVVTRLGEQLSSPLAAFLEHLKLEMGKFQA
jgi:DNA-binding transcriptional LysR family regulator